MAIQLDSFYVYETYSGPRPFDGSRDAEACIKQAIEWIQNNWGVHQTLIMYPKTSNDVFQSLPEKTCIAYLSDMTPLNKQNDGSELIVVWFAPRVPQNPFIDALAHVDARGGWNKNAVDWVF